LIGAYLYWSALRLGVSSARFFLFLIVLSAADVVTCRLGHLGELVTSLFSSAALDRLFGVAIASSRALAYFFLACCDLGSFVEFASVEGSISVRRFV